MVQMDAVRVCDGMDRCCECMLWYGLLLVRTYCGSDRCFEGMLCCKLMLCEYDVVEIDAGRV